MNPIQLPCEMPECVTPNCKVPYCEKYARIIAEGDKEENGVNVRFEYMKRGLKTETGNIMSDLTEMLCILATTMDADEFIEIRNCLNSINSSICELKKNVWFRLKEDC